METSVDDEKRVFDGARLEREAQDSAPFCSFSLSQPRGPVLGCIAAAPCPVFVPQTAAQCQTAGEWVREMAEMCALCALCALGFLLEEFFGFRGLFFRQLAVFESAIGCVFVEYGP